MAARAKQYYDILAISRNATDEEIRKAYRVNALKWHPDKCKEPNAEQRFKDICEAYEVLKDPQKRRRYDEQLDGGFSLLSPFPEEEAFSDAFQVFEELLRSQDAFGRFSQFFENDSDSDSDDDEPLRNMFYTTRPSPATQRPIRVVSTEHVTRFVNGNNVTTTIRRFDDGTMKKTISVNGRVITEEPINESNQHTPDFRSTFQSTNQPSEHLLQENPILWILQNILMICSYCCVCCVYLGAGGVLLLSILVMSLIQLFKQ